MAKLDERFRSRECSCEIVGQQTSLSFMYLNRGHLEYDISNVGLHGEALRYLDI